MILWKMTKLWQTRAAKLISPSVQAIWQISWKSARSASGFSWKEGKGWFRNTGRRRNRICFVMWRSLTWHSRVEWFIARLPLALPPLTLDTLTSVQPFLPRSLPLLENYNQLYSHISFLISSTIDAYVDETRIQGNIMDRKFSELIIDISKKLRFWTLNGDRILRDLISDISVTFLLILRIWKERPPLFSARSRTTSL